MPNTITSQRSEEFRQRRRYPNTGMQWLLITIISLQFYNYPYLGEGNTLEFKVILRLILIIYTLLILLWSQEWKIRLGRKSAVVQVLGMYWLGTFASSFYSVDQASSMTRSLDLSLILACAIAVSSTITNKNELISYIKKQITNYITLFFLQSIAFNESILRPMGEAMPRLGGFTINPNVLAYTILLLLMSYLYKKSFNKIAIVISLTLLGLCLSRTSFITLLIIGIIRISTGKSIAAKCWTGIGTITLISFIFKESNLALNIFNRGHNIENLMTLGGRTEIWGLMMENVPTSWSIYWGYGFNMISENGLIAENSSIYAAMAHNNLIQSLIGLGIIGAILNIMFWVLAFTSLRRYSGNERSFYNFLENTYIIGFCFSMVEFGVFGSSTMVSWIFFIIMFFSSRRSSLNLKSKNNFD